MEEYEKIQLPWSDWKIVKYLGGSADTKVYEIERKVSEKLEKGALKIISGSASEVESYVQQFRILEELQGQSNIVGYDELTVVPHEDGVGGDVFIRMELLISLPQRLKKDYFDENVIKLGVDISNALILCEKEHIIHGNIKPNNILVSKDEEYKLSDFSILKNADITASEKQKTGMEYQAPEVLRGEPYGHTADIYSLGMVMYWLLNNQTLPCKDEKLQPPAIGSEKLKEIVMKACESCPEDRYASAQELYDALRALKNKRTMTMFGVIWSTLAGIAYGVVAIFGDKIGTVILFAILAFSELYSVYYNFSQEKEKSVSMDQKIYVPKLFADFLLCAMPFILVMVLNMDLESIAPWLAYTVYILFSVAIPILVTRIIRSWMWTKE